MPLTVVPAGLVSTVPLNLVPNLYETSFTKAYVIREGRVSSPINYEDTIELFQDRICTLRFRLVKRDYEGNELPFDLTGYTVSVLLKTRAGYNQDTPDTPDNTWILTIENPATSGLCSTELTLTDIPDDEGTYNAEIMLTASGNNHTFSVFTVNVVKI